MNEEIKVMLKHVFQTFVMKCLLNSTHKTFKQHLLRISVIRVDKFLIATGFSTNHLKSFEIFFLSNVLKTLYHKRFLNPYFQNSY